MTDMLLGNVHSFESFGTVDGPGIRFVVFFQGCPMRCLYCHNPDTQDIKGEEKRYTAPMIIDKIKRNLPFYKSGGLTATGGEPLLQIDFLTELFYLAKAEGIHTCLDTSGVTFIKDNEKSLEKFDRLMEVTDLVMLDIKHIDKGRHLALTGWDNTPVLDFAEYLKNKGKRMRIRHVVVPGITDSEESLFSLGRFLRGFDNIEKLELLPYHDMGRVKYQNMGRDYLLDGVPPATAEDIKRAYFITGEAMDDN